MPILDALKAVTHVSAKSLRVDNKVGSIEKSMIADILIWNIKSIEDIVTKIPNPTISQIIKNGKFIFRS
jgi:imidazolonepropionase-like amidohydrolase